LRTHNFSVDHKTMFFFKTQQNQPFTLAQSSSAFPAFAVPILSFAGPDASECSIVFLIPSNVRSEPAAQ